MRAIIINKYGNLIEILKGTPIAGVFKYTRQAWWDLLGIFAKKETLDCQYEKSVTIPAAWWNGGKERVLLYKWDGKNLTQITFDDDTNTSVNADYNADFKLGEYAKAATLKKPFDPENIMKWLAILVIGILLVANIIQANILGNNFKAWIKPLNQTVLDTKQQYAFSDNQIIVQDRICNGTTFVLNRTIAALKLQQGIT